MKLLKYLIKFFVKERVHGFNFTEYYPSDPLSDGDFALLYGWPDIKINNESTMS